MSKITTKILSNAAAQNLCDVVVIGITADKELYIRHSGTTVASLIMYCELAKNQAIACWHMAASEKTGG